MKFPLGALIRRLAKPGSWLARIFGATKGIGVKVGGHEVLLDEREGLGSRSEFDDTPHRPGPGR